jgi:hypothetical protein
VLWQHITEFGAFVLQGGSNTSLRGHKTFATSLAMACFVFFKKTKRVEADSIQDHYIFS